MLIVNIHPCYKTWLKESPEAANTNLFLDGFSKTLEDAGKSWTDPDTCALGWQKIVELRPSFTETTGEKSLAAGIALAQDYLNR